MANDADSFNVLALPLIHRMLLEPPSHTVAANISRLEASAVLDPPLHFMLRIRIRVTRYFVDLEIP